MVSVMEPALYASIPSVLYSDCPFSKGVGHTRTMPSRPLTSVIQRLKPRDLAESGDRDVGCVWRHFQAFISRKQHAVNVTKRKHVLVSTVATNS